MQQLQVQSSAEGLGDSSRPPSESKWESSATMTAPANFGTSAGSALCGATVQRALGFPVALLTTTAALRLQDPLGQRFAEAGEPLLLGFPLPL